MPRQRKRELLVVADEDGERVYRVEVTLWSQRKIDRRMETLMDRYDLSRVTVYDTDDCTPPPDRSKKQ